MSEELYQKNLEALKTYQPHLAPRFDGTFSPHTKIVGTRSGGNLDLDLGHTLLYGTDAEAHAKEQVRTFLNERSQRILQGWPQKPDHGDLIAERLVSDGVGYLQENGLAGRDSVVDEDGGYLIVFGLGLGLHLQGLIEGLDVRSVIVVEQFDEFLFHAMHLTDFAHLFETVNRRKGSLNIIVDNAPETIANFIFYMMRQDSFGLIDGSYIFDHYNSFVLGEAKNRFLDRLPVLSSNPGFFEDEQVMMRNFIGNVRQHEAMIFADKPRSAKKTPVIICGSGPSVDQSIDFVKENRNTAIVMSCGTGLGTLLGYGIQPDFHVEIENTPGPVEIVSALAERHDLSGITLVSSNTVRPELTACFAKKLHFFRDSVCSSKLFGQRFGEIYYAAPTVSNTAARIALGMGFRHLYLVGVDLGAREKDRHHSVQSVYVSDASFLETHPQHKAATVYPITAPGNFGGSVHTSRSFLFASVHFAGLIARYPHVRVWNLSDGIRIPGAVPCLPGSASPARDISQKTRELERLRSELDSAGPGELAPVERLQNLRDALDFFYMSVEAVIGSTQPDGADLRKLFDDLKVLLDNPAASDADICVQRMHLGTLMVCYTFLYRTYRRLPEEARAPFFAYFKEQIIQVLADMRRQSTALTEQLLAPAAA